MTTQAIIAELEALPATERSKVLAHFAEKEDDSWVPESFKKGMADIAAGRVYSMEDALSGAPPPPEK